MCDFKIFFFNSSRNLLLFTGFKDIYNLFSTACKFFRGLKNCELNSRYIIK